MGKKLYVGNLPFNVTQDELTELFSQFGEVQSVNIITDQYTGRSRGFAFVEMENAEQAISELDGQDCGGRALKVNEARDKRGGGGGSGGRQSRGPRRHGYSGGGNRW